MPEPSETPRIIGYTRASDEGGFAERPIYAEPNPTPAPGAATSTFWVIERTEGTGGTPIYLKDSLCNDWTTNIHRAKTFDSRESALVRHDLLDGHFRNSSEPREHAWMAPVPPGAGEMMESEMELKPTEEQIRRAYVIQHPNAFQQEERIAYWNPYPSLADYLCLEDRLRAVIDPIPTPAAPQERTEETLTVRCHDCGGTQIYKRVDGEIHVYHDCIDGKAGRERFDRMRQAVIVACGSGKFGNPDAAADRIIAHVLSSSPASKPPECDEVCANPNCGHTFSEHNDGLGGCTVRYNADESETQQQCICASFVARPLPKESAPGEVPSAIEYNLSQIARVRPNAPVGEVDALEVRVYFHDRKIGEEVQAKIDAILDPYVIDGTVPTASLRFTTIEDRRAALASQGLSAGQREMLRPAYLKALEYWQSNRLDDSGLHQLLEVLGAVLNAPDGTAKEKE